ncbi:two-component response regulator ORR5-like [Ananas comosus]|uniref:Two-component response regulator ORR5-like n=1 Tax=Ananas comosus TaxID=4615 RepID=A0A6P5H2B9_ANACO|nr:two-component response regulator ORR5-like [Ananas comosus]
MEQQGEDVGGFNGSEREAMGLRVLVVDDSPMDRKIVEGLLKSSGGGGGGGGGGGIFEVVAVDSAKKAMEVLGLHEGKAKSSTASEQKIDIILTDYCMPEMTGYDLLKVVKEQSFLKPIPVVVMSSEHEPQRISRCRAIGAEDFIIKPLQATDIHRLREYARPASLTSKAGAKRKNSSDLIAEKSDSERRPRLAGVAAA